MDRPTTRDVAAAAGVSLATVDRVLNARDGVRSATIERVRAAIDAIGFERDLSAANLARRRAYRFEFLLPSRSNEFLAEVVARIDETNVALRHERVAIDVARVAVSDPRAMVQALAAAAARRPDGIAVMAPETPQVRDAIQRVRGAGIAVVAFVSDQPSAACDRFVGINGADAGRTAATLIGRFCGPGTGSVLAVTETIQSRDSLERRFGFDEVLRGDFPHLSPLPTVETHDDPRRTRGVLLRATDRADLRAIYLMGSAPAEAMAVLRSLHRDPGVVVVAHELTPATRQGLLDGALAAVITQDIGHLVRSALRVLRAESDGARIVASQERIRIEIVLRANLPREDDGLAAE